MSIKFKTNYYEEILFIILMGTIYGQCDLTNVKYNINTCEKIK